MRGTYPSAVGLVVIRVWVEPASEGVREDALRSRITTAKPPDLSVQETFTVVGLDGVLAVVREFLTGLAGGAPPASPESWSEGSL